MTASSHRYRRALTLTGFALSLSMAVSTQAQSTGPSFAERDADGSGAIEPGEFRHEHVGPDDPASRFSETDVSEFGDDTGHFDKQEGQELDRTLFKRFDVDDSGGLDPQEYREYQDDVTRRLRDF